MNGSLNSANPLAEDTLGFTASLSSLNDIDVFSFDVPLGSTVRVAISDGMGGCPPDATVKLDIYDPQNLELATTTGLCPVLDGNNEPDLASVAVAGTYFARVTAAAAVASYVIEIDVSPPVCGDGVTQLGEECDDMNMTPADGCENDCTETPVCGDADVQTGEECDDGDTMSGDGCDSMCQLEGDFCPEGEPNETIANATQLTACSGGAGQVTPIGDQDYYRVDVTVPGSSIRAEVVDILGVTNTCPTGFDSVLELFNASGALLGSDDQGGLDGCSLISPTTYSWAQNLPPGAYYVNVTDWLDNGTSLPYVVLVDVLAPGCGDGITQIGEECDDGNLANNDGCSSTCEIEGNYCAEVEPNNAIAEATLLSGCDGGTGQITPTGDADFYELEVLVPGSSIRAETVNVTGLGCPSGADTVIRLYNPAGTEIGSDDQDGNDSCSLINPTVDAFATNLAPGSYFIRVEDFLNNNTVPPYILKASVTPPGCGDDIVQSGEECDDGNTLSNDGCDDLCQIEGNYCPESEPNDSFAGATGLNGCVGGSGAINYVADSDWYSFQVTTAGSSARVEIVDTTGSGCPAGFDSFVRLYNSSMAQLGNDNDDGNASCSLINPGTDLFARNLPVGTYFIRVNENGDDATSQPYLVTVNVAPPGCGDSIVQSGEQCDDGNQNDNDGCTNACTLLSCMPGQVAVTLAATNLPQTILDNTPASPALGTVNVMQTGTVQSIAVGVDVTHSWMGDTEHRLILPNNQAIVLMDNAGGSGDNFVNTVFSSTSMTALSSSMPPWTGIFAPQGGFASVIGTQAAGTWTLQSLDNVGGIAGSLDGFRLILCVQP
jgi:cysteine-rich repeat protein